MILLEQYNAYCASLPATSHVVQWGGAHVWKVGGKVFAIGGWSDSDALAVTFKCTSQSFEILKEQPGLRPAPYLASRGFKWIQMLSTQTLGVEDLKLYLAKSHAMIVEGLSKRKRKELGLL